MPVTGWIGDAPDEAARAMPLTSLVLGTKQREAGDTLAIAAARGRAAEARQAREEKARAIDPDDYAAALVSRGYLPGMASELGMKLADVTAQLESERAKIEKGERVARRVRGLLERGQIGGLDAARMLDGADDGDAHRAEQLERRADSLRRQIRETAEVMVPPEARARNNVEEAASRARRVLADVTSQRQADDAAEAASRVQLGRERSSFYASRGRRPFASRGDAAEPDCAECAAAGATAEESFLIHSDPQPVSVPPAGGQEAARGNFVLAPVPGAVPYCQGCGQVPGFCACTGAVGW